MWKIAALMAMRASVVGMQVQRNEVNAAPDAATLQRFNETVTIFLQPV